MSSGQQQPLLIACKVDAIPANERAGHQATAKLVLAAVTEVNELPDGYRFRLPAQPTIFRNLAEFIANERLCCPFLRFELVVEPGEDTLWLSLTGQEGVKAFLSSEMFSDAKRD